MTKPDTDPFAAVRAATSAHRAKHGCGGYPYSNGSLLSVLAAASQARRILELGTALGYTALSLAHGSGQAHVDTIEADPAHVRLAREQIAAHEMADRVTVHHGDFAKILDGLEPGYDLAFFDGFTPTPAVMDKVRGLLRQGGVLVTANLSHGGTANAVRDSLFDRKRWISAFAGEDRETAISVKL